MKIKIGNQTIGDNEPLYFIADIAANHDGDIERAFDLIELAKESGAHAAKFQNFQAQTIVSRKGFDDLGGKLSHQASWKKSVYEVYEDASVPYSWTARLKAHCDKTGIEYMTSPYDFKSVDETDPYLNAFKVGSGDITWPEILLYIAEKKKPVLLATGASSDADVRRAMDIILAKTSEVVLMQCNTNYTASAENFKYINLNVLKTYRRQYPDVILGLSDHTLGCATVLGAVALGAVVFEKHFTDDNSRTGPDHRFSTSPKSWREMVEAANELYAALGDGIKKIEENEKGAAIVQRRGLRYKSDLNKGSIIKGEDIIAVRPITDEGIPPYEAGGVIGRQLKMDVYADEEVKWEGLMQ